MIFLPFLVPFAAGILAFFIKSDYWRRRLLLSVACIHACGAVYFCLSRFEMRSGPWLGMDALSRLFLAMFSLLFLAVSFYAIAYLRQEKHKREDKPEEGLVFNNAPEAVFTACLLIFLAAMSLLTLSRHFGLIWISMETTTLVSAPLIYFHRHSRSLEATWKYLLICSVGIALALFGNLCLAVAASSSSGAARAPLFIDDLLKVGLLLDPVWLKAAFIFVLVGYGTKMGLAPMHTWLPDAHSEAPSVVSALLSGALLNCAFLAILRFYQVCLANGLGVFCGELFLLFGLFSMGIAALFIVGQSDYKRMLAYSSVEHIGILSFGISLGAGAVYGTLLHAINHSFIKASLFLCAGNILAYFKSKKVAQVNGLLQLSPIAGILWMAGILAICGSPPFGTFLSEWLILKSAVYSGKLWQAGIYLFFLCVIFIGMAGVAISMVFGRGPEVSGRNEKGLRFRLFVPSFVLLAFSVLLGVYWPAWLQRVIREAAAVLGGVN